MLMYLRTDTNIKYLTLRLTEHGVLINDIRQVNPIPNPNRRDGSLFSSAEAWRYAYDCLLYDGLPYKVRYRAYDNLDTYSVKYSDR